MDAAPLRPAQDDELAPVAIAPIATTPSAPTSRLGERLRSLRLAAGMTQTQVGGDRFSKEYISQIERGKTRPTDDAIAWLATQLDVDAAFLGGGVSTDLRCRIEAQLAQAEALTESHRYAEAAELFVTARRDIGATGSAQLEVRALSGEAWALVQEGDARESVDLLQVARELAEGPTVLGRRSRRHPLPARRLSLQARERRDRGRALRPGARARRGLGASV